MLNGIFFLHKTKRIAANAFSKCRVAFQLFFAESIKMLFHQSGFVEPNPRLLNEFIVWNA
jgi:hypothetical protein